jgi:Domain of unknown function (DUF6285)
MSVSDRDILLGGVIDYLDKQLLPTLRGEHRFVTRVALNALAIVQRELRAANTTDAELIAARERLADRWPELVVSSLPQEAVSKPVERATPPDFDQRLAESIRAGGLPCDNPQLLAYLRHSMRCALQINNPKWLRNATEKRN